MIIYLDTNIVIYAVQQPLVWGPKTVARLDTAVAATDKFAISDLTRMECLVGPLRKGDAPLFAAFSAFFTQPSVSVLAPTATVCDRAAQIRAVPRFETPDALHLAAAVENGCGLFLTNDVQLARFSDVPVEVLT